MKNSARSCNKPLRIRPLYLYPAATAFCLIAAFLSVRFGSADLSLSALFSETGLRILLYVRLPRTIACMVTGAALAAAGTVIQGVLANPLASPGIIGVNAGAGLAITVCTALGLFGGLSTALFSFVGAFLAVLLVSFTSQTFGTSRGTLILVGVALNSLFNAFSSTIVTLFPDVGVMSNDFRVGDFSSVTYAILIPASVLILLALALLFTLSNELDVIGLGAESARGLGMNVLLMRSLFLLLAALLAGCAVSLAGLLSFVGLLVPHIVRMLGVRSAKHLLPLSALFGCGFVTVCDLLARLLFAPYEIPVGILIAFLGAPFFLFLLIKRKGGEMHD